MADSTATTASVVFGRAVLRIVDRLAAETRTSRSYIVREAVLAYDKAKKGRAA